MAQFSRRTILAACDLLANLTHANVTRFLLEYGLEDHVQDGSLRVRANSTAQYLIQNTELNREDGQNLVDVVVTNLVDTAISNCVVYGQFNYDRFTQDYAWLQRALDVDG
jgi:hypothetical protein